MISGSTVGQAHITQAPPQVLGGVEYPTIRQMAGGGVAYGHPTACSYVQCIDAKCGYNFNNIGRPLHFAWSHAMNQSRDVPSPVDLRSEADAREWSRQAMATRPWRADFFECIRKHLTSSKDLVRVLELGSGPGFLAEHILSQLPNVHLVLLDFSKPMHAMARQRLAPYLDRVSFVLKSFKDIGWNDDLRSFDHVITNQAVHELRHKNYATGLHSTVLECLAPHGTYLVSDHYAGENGMSNTELFLTVDEHRDALRQAGFTHIQELMKRNGMVLHGANLLPF